MKKRAIRYFDKVTEALPGDRVKLKRWFRYVPGVVVHVPGLSEYRREFDSDDMQEIGVKTEDGLLYGVVIDPESSLIKRSVVFVVRGDTPEPLPEEIDDPYIDND